MSGFAFFCDAELRSLTQAGQSRKHWERRRQCCVIVLAGGRICPHTREKEFLYEFWGQRWSSRDLGKGGAMLTDAEVASGTTGAVGTEVKQGLPDDARIVGVGGFDVPGVKVGKPSADIRGDGGRTPRQIPRIVKIIMVREGAAHCAGHAACSVRASRGDDPYRICKLIALAADIKQAMCSTVYGHRQMYRTFYRSILGLLQTSMRKAWTRKNFNYVIGPYDLPGWGEVGKADAETDEAGVIVGAALPRG